MLSKETFKRVESTLDDILEQFFAADDKICTEPPKNKSKSKDIPINIYDDAEKSVIVALIPGIRHEYVKVELSDDLKAIEISFTTSAEKSKTLELKHREFEDYYGVSDIHKRSVEIINDGVYDLDKINSTLTHGILYINLPKIVPKKKAKPTITINKL